MTDTTGNDSSTLESTLITDLSSEEHPTPKINERNFKQMNRATITLQANVLMHINKSSLSALKNDLKRKPSEIYQSEEDYESIHKRVTRRRINLVDVGLATNTDSRDLFNKSQHNLYKGVVDRYSTSQHNLMLRSTHYGENLTKIDALASCVASPEIANLYKNLLDKKDKKPLDALGNDVSDDISNAHIATVTTPNDDLDSYLRVYCKSKLPPIPSDHEFNTPFEIAMLLSTVNDKFTFNGKTVSVKKVIDFMINDEIVPVKKTSAYRLLDLYNDACIDSDAKWGVLATPGKKAMLSVSGFNYLVHHVQEATLGGASMTLSAIRDLVKERIHKEYKKVKNTNFLPRISRHTLHKYASRIMAEKVFNIFSSIISKTESRVAAEWSIRSTIAYAMVVAVTHFLPFIQPTEYHRKKKEICENGQLLWRLVEKAYTKILNKGCDTYTKDVQVVPVLPNLITSTDETTIYCTPTKIFDKERIYVIARPTKVKNESVDSGKVNNYSTNEYGYAHLRGVRLVLNSTFTAGGLAAPIFVVCYGLTLVDMPYNDIVVVPIPGLTVGADRNIYSTKEGFLVFVRGNYEADDIQNDDERDEEAYSKESRVAKLYRSLVYHPFIHDVRVTQYGMDPNSDKIPDHLQAVGWSDGAQGQIKLITDEDNLKKEHELKITCNKQSAARTAVEQSADLGPTFKGVKKGLKTREVPHQNTNAIVKMLKDHLLMLEDDSNGSRDIVRLASHKKKAILFAIPNLPGVTSDVFTISNVRCGFIYNGQLDPETASVPSFENLVNTYRGDVEETILQNKEALIDNFFEEMLLSGTIHENTFDHYKVPKDTDSKGNIIERPNEISQENRHRAKILSSETQIHERRKLLDSKRWDKYVSKKNLILKTRIFV